MNARNLFAGIGSAVAALVILSGVSNASLIGQDVRFQCTNCFPPTDDTFTVTEGLGPELTLFDQLTVDVEEASLRIGFIFDSSTIVPDLNFLWSDLSWGVPGEIVGATVDASSTWAVGAVPMFTATSVSFTNNGDNTVRTGDFLLINLEVSHDVPEPGTLALFGLGLAGLGFARRRRAV